MGEVQNTVEPERGLVFQAAAHDALGELLCESPRGGGASCDSHVTTRSPDCTAVRCSGNVSAMTFYLDRRGGWKQTVELTGKDSGPITLAAMREAFAAEIEGTAKPVSKKKAKQITDESES
jgi:hypothetical protein